MTLRVNTNVAALNAHRNVQKVNADSVKNLERLSSGMRINTAADGPANLVVSEIMRSQISGLKQAVENSKMEFRWFKLLKVHSVKSIVF